MCGSGMLWHFVSPGLLDILPLGPIVVALLMTGYYHALYEWPVGSTACNCSSEPIVYYPFGLLCQFLASAIYVGRRYLRQTQTTAG